MFRLAGFTLVLTAAALSCWPAPSLAGPTVPYQDSASGILTAVDATNSPAVSVSIAGLGQATYLGLFSMVGSHTLHLDTGLVTDGQFTYKAADGSTMVGIYSGYMEFDASGALQLFLIVQLLPDEGTGRMYGVRGSALTVVTVYGFEVGSPFTYTSEGTLTLNVPQKAP